MNITKMEWRTVSVDESKKDRIRIETRSASVPGGAMVHVMSERRDSRNHNLIVNESVAFVPDTGVADQASAKSSAPDADIEIPAKAPAKKASKGAVSKGASK